MTVPQRSSDAGTPALSADLVVVLTVAVLSLALVAVPLGLSPVPRAVVGVLVVFVAPGYALVAVLFPSDAGGWFPEEGHRLDTVERLVVAIGLSLATIALLALTLSLSGVGLDPLLVVGTTSAFTVATTVVAVVRRRRLAPAERYRAVPFLTDVRSRLAAVRSRPLERANLLIIVVAISIVVATAGIGFAMTQRPVGETFTEFSLLTEDADGDLVADDYPAEFVRGESESLVVAVGNHEHQAQTYTVVVRLVDESDQTRRLDEFSVGPVSAGETVTVEREITPTVTGNSLKLSFLLYRDDAPTDPSAETAYREVHLWIDVAQTA